MFDDLYTRKAIDKMNECEILFAEKGGLVTVPWGKKVFDILVWIFKEPSLVYISLLPVTVNKND